MKRRYDKKHPHPDFRVGDLVMVSAKSHPHSTEPRKFRPKFYGPYVIEAKINDNAYKLSELPPTVPPTQNVSFLRLFVPSPPRFQGRPASSHPTPTEVGDYTEWEVEEIVGHKGEGAGRRYLVQWVGTEDRSWLRPS